MQYNMIFIWSPKPCQTWLLHAEPVVTSDHLREPTPPPPKKEKKTKEILYIFLSNLQDSEINWQIILKTVNNNFIEYINFKATSCLIYLMKIKN